MGCITDISAQKHAEVAALERADLVEKLALRTQQANEHEKNFRQMAEISPCGLSTFSIDGKVTWANSQWYEMTGHSRMPHEHCSMVSFSEQRFHFGSALEKWLDDSIKRTSNANHLLFTVISALH